MNLLMDLDTHAGTFIWNIFLIVHWKDSKVIIICHYLTRIAQSTWSDLSYLFLNVQKKNASCSKPVWTCRGKVLSKSSEIKSSVERFLVNF